MCSLLGPGLAPNVFLYFYTQHSINSAPEASAVSKKVRDVSKGGGWSPEERPYDVSRGQNRYDASPSVTCSKAKH